MKQAFVFATTMKLLKKLFTKLAFLVILINLVFVGWCLGQETSQGYQKYSDLLKEAVSVGMMCQNPYGAVDSYIGGVFGDEGVLDKGVVVKGLDDPNAVPFLIDVLRNGPNWPDERLMTGVFPHIARCLAALCLGSTKDPRAFEPLIDAVRTVDPNEKREYVANYAAQALGLLEDPNAVNFLIDSLRDERVKYSCVNALGRIGDMRAVQPLLQTFDPNKPTVHFYINSALLKITKMKFKYESLPGRWCRYEEFPELGVMHVRGSLERVWLHWWKIEPEFTQKRFEKFHLDWKQAKTEDPNIPRLHPYLQNQMLKAGIPALPYLIEKVKSGDIELITTISQLTKGKLKKTATKEECLEWWKKNKQKWLIPFETLRLRLESEVEFNPAAKKSSKN